ncbi:MAG: protein kinase [Candidatus Eisenbacteria bacterium]|nr:protein kinase [Candidatus Eisenbacteria bacterium]
MSAPATQSPMISHYRLLERLGQGAMGEVWLAEDTQLPRKVAVKLLPAHLAADPEAVERLLREAEAAASVDHPGVVTVYEAGVERGRPFLVMQLVEGPTLEERLVAGPLPLEEAMAIARQVADALAEVHALGIVHRDLKPANIVLSPRGPRILDFGVARVKGAPGMTMTGAAVGTPHTMSPEQLRGQLPDNRCDLWALGVILYECLTGRRPFDGDSFDAVAYQVLNVQPPAASTLRAGITQDLDFMLLKLLRKDPAHRYSRAEDLLADLNSCCLVHDPAPTGDAPPTPRLAVLPFEVMSPEGNDAFLAAGLVEDLVVDLSRVGGLRVASRAEVAPYRDRPVPPRTLARELGVDHVLTGSVRRAGNRARISAQLIRAADGHTLWAERFDRTLEDLFDVQSEVSRKIAEALQVTLKPEERRMLDQAPTGDAEAYSLYIQARQLLEQDTPESSRRAEAMLDECLARDPDFAMAIAALAEVYARRAWQFRDAGASKRALELAEQALARDPSLVDALYAQSTVYYMQDPGKLLETLKRLLALDPDHPKALEWAAFSYLSLGEPERALPIYERLLERHPELYAAATFLPSCYAALGRTEDAARAGRQARERLVEYVWGNPRAGHARSMLAVSLARNGDTHQALQQSEWALQSSPEDVRVAYNRICTLALLGEKDAALDALERFNRWLDGINLQGHDWIGRDPDLAALHGDPRFEQIVRKD